MRARRAEGEAARGRLPSPALIHAVLAIAALALGGAADPAGRDRADLAALVAAARARHLASDRAWLRLVHYRPRLLGGVESDADGPAFFLAPGGKNDPEAELEATLAGFFAPLPGDEKIQHPQCQFPARLAWLSERLGIDPARLPQPSCTRLAEFRARVAARSVTLVFSSYYLNNPASAFGHTFLRLNKAAAAQSGRRFELVDSGIDYAATADTHNAILYAFKGLTGLFQGHWNNYPYFYKVREYADYESRDLWEYDLDLSPAETALLASHLWELGSTWFDYYYLTENCSQGILAALEAAAPRLELLRHVGPIVIPADTVKALYANPGLVRAVHFRPSIRTQFRTRLAALAPDERKALETVLDRPEAPLPGLTPLGEAHVLDAALDYVDFAHARELLDNVVTPAAGLKQRLMDRRSDVGVQSDEIEFVPPATAPQLGHGSMRTGAGAGASTLAGPLAVYDFRLALHDLADPPAGYPALAQIEFLPVRVSYAPRAHAAALEQALLVDIVSLTDFGAFDRHPSWKAQLGATRLRDAGCRGCLAGIASIAGGLSTSIAGDRLTLYALADAALAGAPALDGLAGSAMRLGIGPVGGARLALGDRLSVLGEGGWHALPWAASHSAFDLKLTLRVHLGRISLWAEAARWPVESQVLAGASLFL
ncbi:MAG TPA: DUF4105 domain-containing protein [Myxococcales bacterium]|nr:DUF4105 domain-containing protein [Myxococcales bacterium]